jgi:VWFA-related protein
MPNRAAWLLLIVSVTLPAGGQTYSSQTRGTGSVTSPAPTLTVTTRLVQINVLVHDHHGRPIGDLTKDDFVVTDQGKPQTISLFTVDKRLATPPGSAASSRVMARNVVTNRPTQTAGQGSVTVLLLDFYNTKLTDQMYARRQLVKFLRQIQPGDQIGIYALKGSGFSIVHDFTNNGEALEEALERVMPGFSHELDASNPEPASTADDNANDVIDTSNTVVATFFTRNRVINTCEAFKALANHLEGIPGRKNLVWVSGGFPIDIGFGDSDDRTRSPLFSQIAANDPELFADYIEAASVALNTANVAIYPVDARGLMGLPMADASKNIRVNPRTHSIPPELMHVDMRNIDTMNYIAELTGGKAFYNTNDIGGAVRRAIDDSAVTYTLGYYVAEDNWDNKYHKIKVRVKRPGVTVRTKKGYLAVEQPASPSASQLDSLLRDAVWSPLDYTTLGLTARIDPSAALPNASLFRFLIDPSELQFRQENGKYQASLDVLFVQQTRQGKRIADYKKTLNIAATPAQYQNLKAKGMLLSEDLRLTPNTQAVRIVVLDRFSGTLGSLTIPITPADRSSSQLPPSSTR